MNICWFHCLNTDLFFRNHRTFIDKADSVVKVYPPQPLTEARCCSHNAQQITLDTVSQIIQPPWCKPPQSLMSQIHCYSSLPLPPHLPLLSPVLLKTPEAMLQDHSSDITHVVTNSQSLCLLLSISSLHSDVLLLAQTNDGRLLWSEFRLCGSENADVNVRFTAESEHFD